jgi:hypothetical protein
MERLRVSYVSEGMEQVETHQAHGDRDGMATLQSWQIGRWSHTHLLGDGTFPSHILTHACPSLMEMNNTPEGVIILCRIVLHKHDLKIRRE